MKRLLDPAIRIVDVANDSTVEHVRALFRSYSTEYAASAAETFCLQDFDAEIAELPGKYVPPKGSLLLATVGDEPVGCVGLRDLGGGTCEMKRLYVAPAFRGRGIGRILAEAVIRCAEELGHSLMVLDTLPEMPEAIALYRDLGFVPGEPHWDGPVERTIYLRRPLPQAGGRPATPGPRTRRKP
ncbi:MAG: GNAT family N-acetyltransferase [Isosphaeraceae bacterium]